MALMAMAALVAGCASSPPSDGARASVPAARPVEAGSRPTDKDGPPIDAPSNLAELPDPVPQIEPIKPGGPNKPYVVLGQAYAPVAADVSWAERGVASWYGSKFHGRRTASGEMFSMYGLTAAHRTLPIPSYARVRNLRNGKETIVRINDRGPFHASRVIDLSYAAAVKLGIASIGHAEVDIERLTFDQIRAGVWRKTPLEDDATPVAVAAASPSPQLARAYTPYAKGFWVQLAALGRRDGVDRLQQKVASELATLEPMLAVFHEAPYFKLQVGPYGSRGEALAAAQQAKEALQLMPVVVERR